MPNIPTIARRMTSAQWLSFGRYFFQVPEVWAHKWLESETPEEAARWVQREKPFRYWCSRCEAEFESLITPTKCLQGHLAVDEPDKILLSHKGHEDYVFPFRLSQRKSKEMSDASSDQGKAEDGTGGEAGRQDQTQKD